MIDRLRARTIAGVAGNYDSIVATDDMHCGCRSENVRQEELAHLSSAWTRATVTADNTRYLRGLPFSIDLRPRGGHTSGPRLMLVHGTTTLRTLYWTADRSDDFCRTVAAGVGLRGRPRTG